MGPHCRSQSETSRHALLLTAMFLSLVLAVPAYAQGELGLLSLDHPGGLTRLVVEQEEVIQTGDADDPEFQWRPAGRFQLLTGINAPIGGNPTISGDEGLPLASNRNLVNRDGISYFNLTSKTTIAVDPTDGGQGMFWDVHQLMNQEEAAGSEGDLTEWWVSPQTTGARDISGVFRVPATAAEDGGGGDQTGGGDQDAQPTPTQVSGEWIQAQQTYTLIGDTLRVEYILTNTHSVTHDVGLRIVFDGRFGDTTNDGQSIILPDGSTIDTEAKLPNQQLGFGSVPQTWVSYDSPSDPTVAVRGTTLTETVNSPGAANKSAGVPDSIAWGVMRNIGNDAQYYFTPNQGVSLIGENWGYAVKWNPVSLAPGQSCRFVTFYGEGASAADYNRPYAMMAYAPFALEGKQGDDPSTPDIVEDYYLTDQQGRSPFPVSVYLDNFGTETMLDASVRLRLPTGLELAEGESLTKNVGIVRRNELKSVTWNLRATASRPGEFELKFTGPQGKVLTRTISIPALPVLNPLQSPRGLEMVSIPYQFNNNDAEVVFQDLGSLQPGGTATLIRWDPTTGQYRFFPDPLVTNINPGVGYWLFNQARKVVDLPDEATPVPTNQAFSLRLSPGWTQIGNPFTRPIRFDTVTIIGPDGGEWTLREAYNRQLLIPTIFEYDPIENDYAWETNIDDLVMDPYKGYWILLKENVTIQFPPPTLTAPAEAVEPTSSAEDSDGWRVPVTVTSGAQTRTDRAFGVRADASVGPDTEDVLHPPRAMSEEARALRAAFVAGDTAGESGQLLVDRRPPANENSWRLMVSAGAADQEVTVRWPDLSDVPGELVPTLVDTSANERRYMRTANSYTFNTRSADEERLLKIVVRKRGADTLSVGTVSAQQTDGGSVAVTYSLSVPASVDVTIRNIAGVPIAKVQDGATGTEGLNTATWSGRNNHGAVVPDGRYICHVSARSAETGQSANVITTFTMNR